MSDNKTIFFATPGPIRELRSEKGSDAHSLTPLFKIWPGVLHAAEVRDDLKITATLLRPIFFITLCNASSPAQSGAITSGLKQDYQSVRDYFIRAAEKMPARDYTFKPSADVRTFAQQVAHVADDQYNLCGPAKDETRKDSYTHIEQTLNTKADLVPALKAAFAYCDSANDALTESNGNEPTSNKSGRSRFAMLNWNLWHTWERYGNIVIYLRMKGLVPPSSEKASTNRTK